MAHIEHWIASYGYFGIFSLLVLGILGLPVPDETLLVFSGYLIFRGTLHPIAVFLAGFAGSCCGISLSYLLGRLLGRGVVLRYGKFLGITPPRLEQAHHWYRKIGYWTLTVGYFVPGVRHFTAIAAGLSELEAPIFMTFAYSGAFVWVGSFLLLGFYFGENWHVVLALLHNKLIIILTILFSLFFLVLALNYWKKNSKP
ncbi:MAG: DedA family protein [Terriglobia bacterium]